MNDIENNEKNSMKDEYEFINKQLFIRFPCNMENINFISKSPHIHEC